MNDKHQDPRSHRRPPAAAILLVPLVAALILTLFAWPSSRMESRDLPVGVAGPPAATQQIARQLTAQDGKFEVHRYAGEAAARQAIEHREVYGAFVATPAGTKVLTASAASQGVAQMLSHAASEAQGAGHSAPVPVQDVVAATPAASGLPSSVLPLLIAGILTGVAAATLAARSLGRIGLLVTGSALTGLAATAIIQGWLEVVEGDWAANAAALSLTVLAVASTVAGLKALMGERGVILAALTMVFVANPFSGVASGPELLPEPVGAIGQLMPLGAGGNLLRSTGYFDGAAAGGHVAVLSVWALAGTGALLLAAARRRRPATAVVPAPA